MSTFQQLSENLAKVRERIADAARRSGRSAAEVRLIAVTKYVGPEIVKQIVVAGCHDLGESRPQELWAKAAALDGVVDEATANDAARWHVIGHLQRNKVDRTLPIVSLIHSGDSLRLLEAIDAAARSQKICVPVLLEVNISGDATKHGFAPDDIEGHLPAIAKLSGVEVRGLMCMASREGDLDQARREFAALRELKERLLRASPPHIKFGELSIGMSGDFEVAIEEGATMVRIGSALFEGIEAES
jgi:PLP dependent protein